MELCIDAMFVNRMPFLTSISRRIRYRAGQWVPSEEPKSYIDQLSKLLQLYQRCGFHVVRIFADNAFQPVLEPLCVEHGFQPNCANAQEHVPEAERNHRVIKERVQACFHNSPYKALPRIVLKYLIADCIFKLNLFPAKGGVSSYYSPHHIRTQ